MLQKIVDIKIIAAYREDSNYDDCNNLESKMIEVAESLGYKCSYDPKKSLWSIFKEEEDGKENS